VTDLHRGLAALDPAQRAELERRVRTLPNRPPAPGRGAELPARPPLSAGQLRIWVVEQLGTAAPAYNIIAGWRVEGEIDRSVLGRAWDEVVRRHATLRTVFPAADGEPYQKVLPAGTGEIAWEDRSDTSAAERHAEAVRAADRAAEQRFDLASGPLVRLRLLRFAAEEHALLLSAHHIVLDGWSLAIVVSDLLRAYADLAAGRPLGWEPLPATFADFAARSGAEGADDGRLDYWLKTLADLPQALDLPADRRRPEQPSYRGLRETFWLDEELTAALRGFARRERGTLFTVLLAGWQALLSRYTGTTDIPVGTPISIRPESAFDGVAGMFLNTLVLRGDLSGEPGFRELVRRATARAFEAYERHDAPFETLVSRLADARDLTRNPLFQAMLTLHNTPAATQTAAGLRLRPLGVGTSTSQFDLGLSVTEEHGRLRCELKAAADLFDPGRPRLIAAHFRRLLVEALAEPDRPVAELPLAGIEEQALLRAWNDTARDVPAVALPLQVARTAAAYPDRPALCVDGAWYGYAWFADRVGRLARRLRQAGVGTDSVVGVCLPRGADLVIALHAVQAAGGAYLPLDPEYPADRLRFMIADAGAVLVLTAGEFAEPLRGGAAPVVRLDEERDEIGRLEPLPVEPAPLDALAYVIYTSGSTGRPKAVGVSQRSIINRLAWMQRNYPLGAEDRVCQKTPASFDVSVWEFFWPLCVGAALVVAAPGGHRDPDYLVALMARERVTTVHFVPSMLDVFCEQPRLRERLPGLRRIFASGEELPAELVARCRTALPRAALHNLYGPTEAAVDVTFQPCDGLDPSAAVPIGRPVPNTSIEILDAAGRRVPLGTAGELCIAGVQLARGYLGRPALTAERFPPDPYGPPGARLYRTGDLARWRTDGTVQYLGRIDQQVKIHGFRIEPGEIEAALTAEPEVRAAAVLARGEGMDVRLVAYVVADADADWAARLRRRLPPHLVPEQYVRLDRLPLSANGKLDRRALPAPSAPRSPDTSDPGPATPAEALVARIWQEVLGAEGIGMGEDFFAAGGDSIRGLKIVARLRAAGHEVSIAALFRHRTVRDLAGQLGGPAGPPPAAAKAPAGSAFALLSPGDRARMATRKEDAR
jgi:amino acid adenylation domain-containing protein